MKVCVPSTIIREIVQTNVDAIDSFLMSRAKFDELLADSLSMKEMVCALFLLQ
jgi:hypothetical protein